MKAVYISSEGNSVGGVGGYDVIEMMGSLESSDGVIYTSLSDVTL